MRLRFEPHDLSTYEFMPLVRQPASVSDGGWASAWKKEGEVLLLVANLSNEAKRFSVTPHAVLMESMGDAPLEIVVGNQPPRRILPVDHGEMVLEVDVPAQDFTLTRIVRTAERG